MLDQVETDTIGPKVCELTNNAYRTNDSSLNELISALNNIYHLPNLMEFAYTFRRDKSIKTINNENIEVIDNKKDNSIEIAIVSSSSALNNLESV
ncbi:19412_t:CDS:2 [Cetraspora pellucida]|uniref:19412_t:CDS:1 n=1 Tax=Cetraspora pellucida TaxID=1433469 RepID=A0A9N9GHU5_9GLOM|nr:19412_t:CDS:2 [Cetraspora pellucida]